MSIGALQRPEPSGTGASHANPKQAGSKPAAARPSGAAGGEPALKQSRLAKQSSTNAVTAARALDAAGHLPDQGDDQAPAAAGRQLVPVKQEKQEREEKQQRRHHHQQQQQQATGSDQFLDIKPASSDKHAVAAAGGAQHKVEGQIVLAGGPHAAAAEQQPAVFVEPPGGGQWSQAKLQLSKVHNFQQLLRQLQDEFPHLLPDRDMLRIKVVYQDGDGDWVMAMPDQRWRSFMEVAKKVLVCHTP